jgi:hypothetical protein
VLRFAVISSLTLAVLGLVFYLVVWHAQPPAVAQGDAPAAVLTTPISTTQNSSSMVGPGLKPWVESFEDGKLSSKFSAVEYTPQKDGSFIVDHPVSIFYLEKGQIMKVTGESGQVNCDTSGPKASGGGIFAGPTSPPKNGSLHHVRVELFPSENATVPTEWMETENIHFDNETLPTMFTESYVDAAGNTVAADQVPVTVRGDEYEFDGNGLTLVWNAQKRLENLEIYHGKRLEIINPGKLSLPGMTAGEAPRQGGAALQNSNPALRGSSEPVSGGSVLESGLVSVSPADVSLLPGPVKKQSSEPAVPFRAVFNDNVKIKEAARTTATADLMTVDFLQGHSRSNTPQASPGAARAQPSVPQPSSPPATPVRSALAAVKGPATKPANGPITIYWTGPLVVTPIKGQPMLPLAAGQSVVRLLGSPVRLTPEGSEVTAASALYRSPDGAVQLEHSGEFPHVHLRQTKGLNLSTGSIDYDPANGIATLSGASALQVPVDKKQMNVSWSQQGLLHIVRQPGQPNGVDHVDLIGDVAVSHPQFGLNSRELQLDLDLVPKQAVAGGVGAGGSGGADEQLRQLTAFDNVICQLTHPGKPMQEIDSDKLVIRTTPAADHHGVVPREVIADGQVHAFDPDQSITARHLDALLLARAKPATPPGKKVAKEDANQAVDLESLLASEDVHARLKNGATADTDQLRVTTLEGRQTVDLWGPRGAVLSSKDGSWLAGPVVHLVPDRSLVSVDGAGMMETIRTSPTTRPANSPPPKPIDVSWADRMVLDGQANVADVYGNVTVRNTDSIGTASTISGDSAHLDLVDTPKNNRKKPAAVPATQPDPLGSKQLRQLTLSGNVVGRSELNDSAGNPLRRGNLYGEKLIYTASTDKPGGTATIPGPGKLFVENHKADVKAGSNAGSNLGNANAGSSRGAMAIQWDKLLVYDQSSDKITIDGDTRVGFEQEHDAGVIAKPAAPMQLDSQQLIVTLSKTPVDKSKSKAGDQGKMQLSRMQSSGQVHFVANGVNLYCDTMDYDPVTCIMTLKGSSQRPGRAMDANQSVSGSFDELRYDTAQEEIIDGLNLKGKLQR